MKKNITTLVFLFVFALIFSGIPAFAGGIAVPANTGLPDPGDDVGSFRDVGPVLVIIYLFVSWLLAVFTLLAVIAFVITGIQYFLAFGDTYKAETAKKNFVYSVIAVTVVGGGMVIIRTINRLL